MENKIDLSIIIVNYNTKDLTIKNLESIFKFTNGISYKVYVVDNGSSDGSVNAIIEKFGNKNIKIYDTKQNNGFSKGNNIPNKDINSRYILYMNPDMEIQENVFLKMVQFMDKNKDIDISTCTLRYPDGEIQHNIKTSPTFFVNLLILLKLHNFFPNIKSLRRYFSYDFDYSKQSQVEQIMGAFVFARYEAMEKLNFWDEKYFLWWEDVDLFKRAKDLKLNVVYTPITSVIHYEGKSFFQLNSISRQRRFNNGMLIYSKKYFTYTQYIILKMFSYLSLLLAYITQILNIEPRGQGKI